MQHPNDYYKSTLTRIFKKIKFLKLLYLNKLILTEHDNELTDPNLPGFIKNI